MAKNEIQGSANHLTFWERWAYLMGRLVILLAMIYIPLIFYTWTWRHFAIPKMVSFEYLVLILIASWAVIATKRRFFQSVLAIPMSFLAMMILFSILLGANMGEGWEQTQFYIACIIFAVLIPKFLTRQQDFEVLTFLMGIVCIAIDLYALAQKFSWSTFFYYSERIGIEQFTKKPVSFMGNENYTAEFMNIAVPLMFFMVICHWRRPAQMFFFAFVTLFNISTMYFIDCNASYVGFIVAFSVLIPIFIWYRVIPYLANIKFMGWAQAGMQKGFRHILVVGILLIAIVGTIIASVPNKIRYRMNTMVTWMDVDGDYFPDAIPPVVFRLQCMDSAIRTIQDNPVLGIGAGNFKVVHPLYENQLERKVLGEETLARKVHNDHLSHAAEYGVFGLYVWYWVLAVSMVVGFISVRILNKKRFLDPKTAPLNQYVNSYYFYFQLGLLGGIITSIISCCFGHTFVIPSSAVTFWFAVGVTAAIFQILYRLDKNMEKPILGTISRPLNRLQQMTSLVPGYLRIAVFFVMVLPVGIFIMQQYIAETWMKYGMGFKDREMPLYQSMFSCFDKTFQYYPYQMEAFYILGRYYIDAVMHIDTYAEQGQQGKQVLQQIGLKADQRQPLIEEGIVTLQSDIYMNPNYKWAHNNLGVLYDRLGSKLKGNYHARAAYNRVLSIDDEQIYAHYNLGLGAMNRGEYEEAIDRLQMALVVDPGKTEIYRFLGRCFAQVDHFDSAITALDKYLGYSLRDKIKQVVQQQDRTLAQYEEVLEALKEGDVVKALSEAKRTISFKDEELHYQYLFIARDLAINRNEKLDLALDAVTKSEMVYSIPENDELLLLYGNIYYVCGAPERTAEKFEEYLRLKPNNLEIRNKLTNLYTSMQEFEEALSTFERVVQMRPNEWSNQTSYANLLLANGASWKQVFPIVQKAVELGGDEAREFIAEESNSNLIYQFLERDPRLQELVGTEYWETPEDATATIPEATEEAVIEPEDIESATSPIPSATK